MDGIIIVLSIVVVVMLGLWAGRGQDKSARGYFLASGRMPWWLIGTAFVSTSVSSEQIVGTVGAAYQYGMSIANWEWFSLPVITIFLGVFIPVYLKNGVTTLPEFLSRRYGPLCGDIYSWVMLFAYVFVFLVPVLYGGSITISKLTGWNFYAVLWVMVLLVGLYTVKGGLASVMWTDAAQCLMLVGGGVLLFFIALNHIPGGWAEMVRANPDRFHLYRPPDDDIAPFAGLLCGVFGVFIWYTAANQVMIQRVLSARSTWDGMMGIIFSAFINLLRPLVTCFLGFIVYHWIHELGHSEPLDTPDATFAFALREFAPGWGLRGIVVAGFLAAVMSTVSALTNSTATIFSLDVYQKFINPEASDAKIVRVGRCTTAVTLIAAAVFAPAVASVGGIFQYFQNSVTYLATPFISAVLLGILWKRANYAAGLFALTAGLAIAGGAPVLNYFLDLGIHWLYMAFIAELTIIAGMVVVALATSPPPEERAAPFHWRPRLLLHLQPNGRWVWYKSLLLWYCLFAGIWVYLFWRYW